MDRDRATQPFRFAVNGPIFLRAQVRHVHTRRRQHRAGKTQIADDAPKLDDCLRRLLQRNQPHRLETRAFRYIGVMDPVVVSAGELDGPVAADDLAKGETGAGVEHRGADADVFKKEFPAFSADVGKCALRRKVAVCGMQMIDGRKRALAAGFGKTFADVVSRHVFPNARNVFHDMAVAVDNFIILRHRLTSRMFPSAASAA